MDRQPKRRWNNISNDASCDILTNVTKFNYAFPIQQFSFNRRNTGEGIKSGTFVTGWKDTSEWYLNIYPNGQTEESKDYVSVSLVLLKPDKAEAKYRFSILCDKEKKKNVSDSHMSKEFIKNEGLGFPKFVKKDFLMDKSNGLLNDGKLTIICELSVVGKSLNYQFRRMLIDGMVPRQSRLSYDFRYMLDSSLLSDCTIKVGNSNIKVHKAVLAARSSVFYDIFNGTLENSQTDVIEIKDFHVESLKEMLNYIYTDEVSDIQNVANEMLEIAIRYKLYELEKIVKHYLCSSLTIENICERYSLSEKYSIKMLKKVCQELILENLGCIVKTKEWKEFVIAHPLLIEGLFLKSMNIVPI
uniref:Speckle-type POZ protein-like (inferred by orthology to a human protein) n=1 Tax=Strongyloides papillosus TaxID=174720 RepID=A0A0N5BS27_STREA